MGKKTIGKSMPSKRKKILSSKVCLRLKEESENSGLVYISF